MEPQENRKIGLQKAINAHELALSAMADLAGPGAGPRTAEQRARLERNVAELREEEEGTRPDETV